MACSSSGSMSGISRSCFELVLSCRRECASCMQRRRTANMDLSRRRESLHRSHEFAGTVGPGHNVVERGKGRRESCSVCSGGFGGFKVERGRRRRYLERARVGVGQVGIVHPRNGTPGAYSDHTFWWFVSFRVTTAKMAARKDSTPTSRSRYLFGHALETISTVFHHVDHPETV
jgi:hypothetical protein